MNIGGMSTKVYIGSSNTYFFDFSELNIVDMEINKFIENGCRYIEDKYNGKIQVCPRFDLPQKYGPFIHRIDISSSTASDITQQGALLDLEKYLETKHINHDIFKEYRKRNVKNQIFVEEVEDAPYESEYFTG